MTLRITTCSTVLLTLLTWCQAGAQPSPADAGIAVDAAADSTTIRVVRLPEMLAGAIALYQRSEFVEAQARLEQVLVYTGDETSRTAAQALTYLGCVHIAFGRAEAALEAFEKALDMAPDLTLPVKSPKIEAAFGQARRRYRQRVRAMDHDPPRLRHEPATEGDYGRPLAIEVEASDVSGIKRVVLNFRQSGNRGFSSVTMEKTKNNKYLATVPGMSVARPGVEYYLQSWDTLGNGPGVKGSSLAPIKVAVKGGPAPSKGGQDAASPWYKRWWFWASVAGVVAVAGGVGTAIYLSRDETARFDLRIPSELAP